MACHPCCASAAGLDCAAGDGVAISMNANDHAAPVSRNATRYKLSAVDLVFVTADSAELSNTVQPRRWSQQWARICCLNSKGARLRGCSKIRALPSGAAD